MTTDKKAVQLLVQICLQKGIRKVVFSPGSRSAPLVIAFSAIKEIECLVIPDERVAGYFALGMAQQLRQPVAVVCTSGTAVMNLTPAICEAYYQRIPLLAITADRHGDAVSRGENQAIYQAEVMESITGMATEIDGEANTRESLEEVSNEIYSALSFFNYLRPVHINVMLREPLYETVLSSKKFSFQNPEEEVNEDNSDMILSEQTILKEHLLSAEKILLVIGSHAREKGFIKHLSKLAKRNDVVVLTESISNCVTENVLYNYDACLHSIKPDEAKQWVPDVLITFGTSIVSKQLRTFFKKNKPGIHCDAETDSKRDFFETGKSQFQCITEDEIIEVLLECEEKTNSGYRHLWAELHRQSQNISSAYYSSTPFSDLKVFETLTQSFPDGANIQYGNSTPIRYSNFFPHKNTVTVNANRGTSGIDGCVSTAAGAAHIHQGLTISIVGDVSFFYDSNALWNNHLSPNLRIIVINNHGGNIFRLIEGPNRINDFEKFFETKHPLNASHLASMFGLPYYICARQSELDEILKTFYQPSTKAQVLEITTDGELNAKVFRDYLNHLKQ